MADDFVKQIEAFRSKTQRRLDTAVGFIVADVAERVDERSPVGQPELWAHPAPKDYRPGTFRGGWQLGVDSMPHGQTGLVDPTGEAAQVAIRGAIPEQASGHVYFITNNVVYGPRLENGWSSQAPNGMVAITALEFPQIVRAAAARAK